MRTVNGCILLLAAISITFAAVSGAYHLDMQQLLALILRQENVPVQEQIVFWQIRVPRILAALFLGAALAGAGTTYQGMFRNPLVSPDILGVSARCRTWCLRGNPVRIIHCLHPAVRILRRADGGRGRLVDYASGDPPRSDLNPGAGRYCIRHVVRSGDIANKNAGRSLHPVTVNYLLVAGAVHRDLTRSLLCCTDHSHRLLAPVFLRWRMNLLTLSDDEARSLGLNVTRLRFGLIVCATLITASTVAIAGIIGWVGLVVPHIARLLTGHNHQQLLPMAMCTGAILLLLTDTLARSIGTTEIPLGILTAFVGAPFFLFLLLRGGRQ